MIELTAYQEKIRQMLGEGHRLERRRKEAEFCRFYWVWVLVKPDGSDFGTVREVTVDRLIAAGVVISAEGET